MAITETFATELCADVDLEDEARALLREEHNARQFVDALVEAELYLEAIKVLARALPKLHAVEWACVCIRQQLSEQAAESEAACLAAAEQWVGNPGEDKRLAAMAAAAATEYDTASAWAAMAAGWTGGSMGPPDVPPIPPPAHLTALAVAGAIGLASARVPEKIDERQLASLQEGFELGARPDPVTPEPAASTTGETP